MNDLVVLSAAGFVAGVMDAMAGGGTFVTIPALVWAGTPSLVANASSTVALFPGQLASTCAYRGTLADLGAVSLRSLLVVSVSGGFVGSLLLLLTPERAFDVIVPWLLLIATLAFAFGARAGAVRSRNLRRLFRRRRRHHDDGGVEPSSVCRPEGHDAGAHVPHGSHQCRRGDLLHGRGHCRVDRDAGDAGCRDRRW
ncbi:MAG TPA: sulfite exporter TauE/SafE family protein [Beijerinckiaceae bacterium]|nr:sulfite exporter TauE/SafE family protein [Beijerinckiaceae bacterium]